MNVFFVNKDVKRNFYKNKIILKFIMIIFKIPGKLNLYGEYIVSLGYEGCSFAINKFIIAQVELSNEEKIIYKGKEIDILYDINQFIKKCKIEILENEIPIGKGLGSSSVYFLLISSAHLYIENKFNYRNTFELALKLERENNKLCSGIDIATSLVGGLIFYKNENICKYPTNLISEIYLIDTKIDHKFNNCNNYFKSFDKIDVLNKKAKDCKNKIIKQDNSFFRECINYYNLLKEIIPIEIKEMSEISNKYLVKSTGYGFGGMMFSLNKVENCYKCYYESNGLKIIDNRFLLNDNYFLNKINLNEPNIGDIGFSSAPSNIALLKYWGKKKNMLQIASNPSISMTIPGFRSFTKLTCRKGYKKPNNKLEIFLKKLLNSNNKYLEIETYNNFPTSSGIASSASGYASIVKAYFNMINETNYYKLINWARIGSGSACRSCFENELDNVKKETLICWNLDNCDEIKTELNLGHILVIFNPFPKIKLSSEGHLDANKSKYYEIRKSLVNENFKILLDAFKNNEFEKIKLICESDSMMMHSIMKDTYIDFISDQIEDFLSKFIEYRNIFNLSAMFTQDAGENIHIIYKKDEKLKLLNFLEAYPCIALMESNNMEYNFTLDKTDMKLYNSIKYFRRCILISGKRYSGKTYLSDILNKKYGFKVYNLSDNIKKLYCLENSLKYEIINNREVKEKHRLKMIKFMEAKLDSDNYFWCKKLFNEIDKNCRIFIISDARRINDINYFSKVSDLITIRIKCCNKVRKQRGWVENEVDNLNSEEGLDNYKEWDIINSCENLEDINKIYEKLAILI